MDSFYQLSLDELEGMLISNELNPAAASKLFNWHYKKKEHSPCEINFSKSSQTFIQKNLDFSLPKISTVFQAKDKTVKFSFELDDGLFVETVLIPFHNKYSICLSSQVGCGMNCSFCYTGTQGFKRNLKTHEITGQFLQAWNWLKKNRPGEERVSNIVFMGQGEPLHNFDAVKKACNIFLSQNGTSIAAQKITISTSGYLPGLKRWVDEMPKVNLALSLHSPFTKKRNELIPINKAFPLNEVLDLIDQVPLSKKQFITYEYLLIEDFNDSDEDAHAVGRLIKEKPAYINLIPFNPFPGVSYKRPTEVKIQRFKEILDEYKIPTLIRTTKGDDVLAACGQLKTDT